MATQSLASERTSESPYPAITGSDADSVMGYRTKRLQDSPTGEPKRLIASATELIWRRETPNMCQLTCYHFVMPFGVMVSVGFMAYYFDLPFVFPSLGPTAFLHFVLPDSPPASPKNTLVGHFIGVLAGSASLQCTFLYDHDNVFDEGMLFNRIWCSALSVGLTCCLMALLNVGHPPAGATTLIVSLGLLKTPIQLATLMAAIAVLTVEAFIINRIFRTDAIYPWWSIGLDEVQPGPFAKLSNVYSFDATNVWVDHRDTDASHRRDYNLITTT